MWIHYYCGAEIELVILAGISCECVILRQTLNELRLPNSIKYVLLNRIQHPKRADQLKFENKRSFQDSAAKHFGLVKLAKKVLLLSVAMMNSLVISNEMEMNS